MWSTIRTPFSLDLPRGHGPEGRVRSDTEGDWVETSGFTAHRGGGGLEMSTSGGLWTEDTGSPSI